ncbi:hypothetical protein [Micromonospora carbonacea]|uniref:DUF5666 domain-containing protein n=1 Tax=Micromonospora carbonacea TaxID=47853 RepID=A0A1C5AZ20_9ACTN|nr:hypothetical protein [Micromonospora carbonacea]SCF50403.1 hypothetical protein GA0070563_13128 [Micromonospora carbonacea]
MTRYRAGDQVTATLDDTAGTTITTQVTATRVDKLGCGCQRIRATRPGPDQGPSTCRTVHLLTGCGGHPAEVSA